MRPPLFSTLSSKQVLSIVRNRLIQCAVHLKHVAKIPPYISRKSHYSNMSTTQSSQSTPVQSLIEDIATNRQWQINFSPPHIIENNPEITLKCLEFLYNNPRISFIHGLEINIVNDKSKMGILSVNSFYVPLYLFEDAQKYYSSLDSQSDESIEIRMNEHFESFHYSELNRMLSVMEALYRKGKTGMSNLDRQEWNRFYIADRQHPRFLVAFDPKVIYIGPILFTRAELQAYGVLIGAVTIMVLMAIYGHWKNAQTEAIIEKKYEGVYSPKLKTTEIIRGLEKEKSV